jgi:hypothetical protein
MQKQCLNLMGNQFTQGNDDRLLKTTNQWPGISIS